LIPSVSQSSRSIPLRIRSFPSSPSTSVRFSCTPLDDPKDARFRNDPSSPSSSAMARPLRRADVCDQGWDGSASRGGLSPSNRSDPPLHHGEPILPRYDWYCLIVRQSNVLILCLAILVIRSPNLLSTIFLSASQLVWMRGANNTLGILSIFLSLKYITSRRSSPSSTLGLSQSHYCATSSSEKHSLGCRR